MLHHAPTEGVIHFDAQHTLASLPASAQERAAELAAWRRLMIEVGAVGRDPARYDGAGYGNLSARVGPYPGERGRRPFVITASQTSSSDPLSKAELCLVERYRPSENRVWSRGPKLPSSESMTHGALYDLSPAIRWVFHGHVPVVWRAARQLRLPTTAPEVGYGTPEMAREVGRLYRETSLSEGRLWVMGGHEDGIIAFGRTAREAGGVLMEALARAYALSG